MKKLLLFAFAAAAFTSCSDDIYYYSEEKTNSYTVDFESAVLGEDGYIWGKPLAVENEDMGMLEFDDAIYTDGLATFFSYYTDWGANMDTWVKFAISACHDKATFGLDNQFSVYTTADDGVNHFAVGYDMKGMAPGYMFNPVIEFSAGIPVESLRMANTTFTYLYMTEQAYSDFSVSIIGFNKAIQTGVVSVSLAANNKVLADWQDVDLTSLGMVTKLIFSVECEDKMAPTYFCIDDLTYRK